MGNAISYPLSVASAIAREGPLYWVHYFVSYFYLTLIEKGHKKRFDLYDFQAVGQPETNGFFVAKIERILDPPSKTICLEENSDDAFIHGTNSKSEYFAVYIRRLSDDKVQCSFLLQTADGKSYALPKEYVIQKAISEDNTFGSSRLKLQCLLPMRKWRIFFNGILEEHHSDEGENVSSKHIHAKFAFLWTASSEVFDFSSDISKTVLSQFAASSSSLSSPNNSIKRLTEAFDCYEQPGMILGTITLANESEKEMYFWGTRRRFKGKHSFFKQGKSIEIYGFFENGNQIHLGFLKNLGKMKSLTYGYIMKRSGYIYPMDEIHGDIDAVEGGFINIKFSARKQWYHIKIKQTGINIEFEKVLEGESWVNPIEITIDDVQGRGLLFKGSDTDWNKPSNRKQSHQIKNVKLPLPTLRSSPILCIPFDNLQCGEQALSGGKGSSLGILYNMSLKTNENGYGIKFHVPKGLVVSTDAYKEFITGPLVKSLQKFEKDIWYGKGETRQLCQKMVQLVNATSLPENVSHSVIKGLKAVFGENISDFKFAVRSSATGEDTEQMSAAGQMETFLGVKGIEEILCAVKKCWASQFTFQAVEYKRGYGQLLNTPMAVVIQEMVPCDVAGVIFTCDPVSGNPSFVSITANWGLGESVVSASADPDTITLQRSLNDDLNIYSKQAGNKKTKIVMAGEHGTEEVSTGENDASSFCISKDMALKMGKIAVEVEKYYGNPRDIEWGILKDDIFLFQSRPVTSLDMETDFETKHAFDTFQRTEKSFWTRANVGEVMPGASSPLGLDVVHRIFDLVYRRRYIRMDEDLYPHKPYFEKGLTYCYSQCFLNILGGFRTFGQQNELQMKCFAAGTFGRLSDDKGYKEEMNKLEPLPMLFKKKVAMLASFFYMAFFSGRLIRKESKRLEDIRIECEGLDPPQILQKIAENYDIVVEGLSLHLNATFSSILWNVSILMMLSKIRGDCDNVAFSDFAYLLSTCKDVESASVPEAIQDLGVQISKEFNYETFKKMSVEDALNWLKNNTSETGRKFREFLERHGHRCLKEFDMYAQPWKHNPTPVITMLQQFASDNAQQSTAKEVDSFSTILSKLHVKLSFFNRLYLRWLLPHSRRGVQEREQGKSLFIFLINTLREPFHRLAELLVEEGRLPRKELLFFLCVEEIQQLFESRSPRLITKAMRRFKVHEELNKLVFPEMCGGIPKPINDEDDIPIVGKGLKMTGVPVSQGVVKATARVVMNLEEAKTIQQGDILITYSTDIGWSPYFPLLSGVVTELGGIISHGAVVAREYGLPCVVNLHGVTRVFKSGDLVILDGTKGILQKAEEDEEE